ncbi:MULTISPECIES: NAD-dependent protein deacylase [unclassified Fusibacter]|uniref:NAD-dependent protein deacylase n=1 Tax=unclassified Fusibacter TaxID=2624464 RepID=UPI001012B2DA|nr:MULTISPECIES: NAD-dependent protein deacylase [unclassified Fusibacter]MCK8061591.1 NAD-dependent protein deacylase [Fusibacter sp. A2]NPE23774.1 NAD-dependent protein deacylase [Fusibacter sp. A1]RXV58679.1 NAD-dependent protein deacylase [Fusibacter sp. A1]
MSQFDELVDLIRSSSRIVFFGGAGVSTESGIPDFRSVDGLYALKYKYPPETMLSYSFFEQETDEFFKFYRDKVLNTSAIPNKAHLALARLEQMDKLTSVVTQNIDGLHQKAGSKRVHELHGSVLRNYCVDCGKNYSADYVICFNAVTPRCSECGGVVRPDVVLYEEGLNLKVIDNAVRDIEMSDLLIIGGTSLVVYPAASLIKYHKKGRIVLINKGKTPADHLARLTFDEAIGELLGRVMEVL